MILQLLVAILGLLIYVLSNPTTNPKVVEIGRILFWTGTLSFLLGTHFPILGH